MDASVPIFQQTLGSLGLDIPPAGETGFEELVTEYRARLRSGLGPVHICGMTNMAECRAAMIAAREMNCAPVWVSWSCDGEGESATRVHMLAALFVAEGMGAAAFGIECPEDSAGRLLCELSACASTLLYEVRAGEAVLYPYECGPDLLEDIIAAEDDPVGAVKIAIQEPDDVEIFAEHQYAVREALCLWSDVPELLEGALRVYQGRAFYDGTGQLEQADLDRMSRFYGLIVL